MRAGDGKPFYFSNLFTCSLSTLDFWELDTFKLQRPSWSCVSRKEHTAQGFFSSPSMPQMRISCKLFFKSGRWGKEQGRESFWLQQPAPKNSVCAGNHGLLGATACALAAEPERTKMKGEEIKEILKVTSQVEDSQRASHTQSLSW